MNISNWNVFWLPSCHGNRFSLKIGPQFKKDNFSVSMVTRNQGTSCISVFFNNTVLVGGLKLDPELSTICEY